MADAMYEVSKADGWNPLTYTTPHTFINKSKWFKVHFEQTIFERRYDHIKIQQWLNDNNITCIFDYCCPSMTIWFHNEKDAMLCKLRWHNEDVAKKRDTISDGPIYDCDLY